MALAELIKFEGDNTSFIWKHPSEDFNKNSELIVNESQEAIFFANGQASESFGPGRYKLDSSNIPFFTSLINKLSGTSVFHCQVYFISRTVQMAVKWGTDTRVRFVEPTLGVPVEIGASGEMNLEVSDGRKLLIKLVGTMKGIAWDEEGEGFTKTLKQSFKPLISTEIKSNLASAIKHENIDIVEIDEHLSTLSNALKLRIINGFEEYGLTIPQFYVTNIALPEDDPNFKRLRELHTIGLQQKMATAEAEVRTTQAESKASYMTAEAAADAKIKEAQRAAVLEEQTTETEILKREAERKLIMAQADAEANKMAGFSEAAVMQAQGYDKKDVLQAEVQKAYAEGIGNMGSGGGGGGGSVMGDVLGLGVGMAAMGAITPQIGEMMKGFNNTENSNPANNMTDSIGTSGSTCPKCGNPLPRNAKFCLECGSKVELLSDNEMICSSCGAKTHKGKFCMECGASLINKCPNCDAEVPSGAKFCLNCGNEII